MGKNMDGWIIRMREERMEAVGKEGEKMRGCEGGETIEFGIGNAEN
jgi:hypothetical protein